MAQVLINETTLTNIADAIREKNGATDTYKPSEMAPAIQELTMASGGIEDSLVDKSIAPSVTSYTNDRVSQVSSYAFYGLKGLQEVSFPNATAVGLNAFTSCKDLTSIDLPLVETVLKGAFSSTGSLTEMTFPKLTYLPGEAFRNSGITTINAPLLEAIGTSAADYATTSTGGAFFQSAITNLNLPKLSSIGPYTFYYSSGLTNISLPSLVTIKNNAFYRCANLTTISMPNIFTIEKNAFYDCEALSNVTFNPSGFTAGDYAFEGCNFSTLRLNLTTTAEINNMADLSLGYRCFANNKNLTSVKIIANSGVPTQLALDGNVFYGCENLTSVVIKIPTMTDSTSPILIPDNAFANCPNLTSIKVSWSKAWQEADGYLDNAPWGATNATVTYNYTGS